MRPEHARALHTSLSADDELRQRFQALRARLFPIRPSQYDVTNLCNLSCVGCLYFDGPGAFKGDVESDPRRLDAFYRREAARGVNFGHFGGAEPSLNQAALAAAFAHIPRGTVYTNGRRRIAAEIGYRLHISVWAAGPTEGLLRGTSAFRRALDNYAGDPRALFVLTLTSESLAQLPEIAAACSDGGFQLSFNQYSPTEARSSSNEHLRAQQRTAGADTLTLQLDEGSRVHEAVERVRARYPQTIVYSPEYFTWFGSGASIHRLDPATGWSLNCASRLTDTMRHFRPDLSRDEVSKCCTPNVDCGTCRLYSMSYSTQIGGLADHVGSTRELARWVSIVETWEALFCPAPAARASAAVEPSRCLAAATHE